MFQFIDPKLDDLLLFIQRTVAQLCFRTLKSERESIIVAFE